MKFGYSGCNKYFLRNSDIKSKKMLGILDLRVIGHYKIKQGILQQNVSNYYRLESAHVLCEQFNKFINTLKKEREEMNDKYPWLDQVDERRNLSDKEILDKYVDLEKTCLSDSEKETSNGYVIQI